MIKQSMELPIPAKCYKQTAYPLLKADGDVITRVTWPTCIYLKKGKCQLNGCVKNTRKVR